MYSEILYVRIIQKKYLNIFIQKEERKKKPYNKKYKKYEKIFKPLPDNCKNTT